MYKNQFRIDNDDYEDLMFYYKNNIESVTTYLFNRFSGLINFKVNNCIYSGIINRKKLIVDNILYFDFLTIDDITYNNYELKLSLNDLRNLRF